jgi:hypothetical protein
MPIYASSDSAEFQLLYQINPIVLIGGIAGDFPGGQMSIVQLTQPDSFTSVLGPVGFGNDLDSAWIQFIPIVGDTLIDNDAGEYPFANQQTAANCIITKPLHISMQMICPAQVLFGMDVRSAILQSLQDALFTHNILGGMYNVATPAFYFTNCIMKAMRNITPGDEKQAQTTWELDFEQPLVTQEQAQAAMSVQLQKVSSGLPVTTDASGNLGWGSTSSGIGQAFSGQGTAIVPSVANQGGAALPSYSLPSQPGGFFGN